MGKGNRKKGRIQPTLPLERQPSPRKPITEPASVSFRYIDEGGPFCLSMCNRDDVRAYQKCLRLLTTLTWEQVRRTGGKDPGKRTGLNYTRYEDSALLGVTRPARLSPEIRISAVRASGKPRLFGAFEQGTYYVLWFDRNHRIVKG